MISTPTELELFKSEQDASNNLELEKKVFHVLGERCKLLIKQNYSMIGNINGKPIVSSFDEDLKMMLRIDIKVLNDVLDVIALSALASIRISETK